MSSRSSPTWSDAVRTPRRTCSWATPWPCRGSAARMDWRIWSGRGRCSRATGGRTTRSAGRMRPAATTPAPCPRSSRPSPCGAGSRTPSGSCNVFGRLPPADSRRTTDSVDVELAVDRDDPVRLEDDHPDAVALVAGTLTPSPALPGPVPQSAPERRTEPRQHVSGRHAEPHRSERLVRVPGGVRRILGEPTGEHPSIEAVEQVVIDGQHPARHEHRGCQPGEQYAARPGYRRPGVRGEQPPKGRAHSLTSSGELTCFASSRPMLQPTRAITTPTHTAPIQEVAFIQSPTGCGAAAPRCAKGSSATIPEAPGWAAGLSGRYIMRGTAVACAMPCGMPGRWGW